MSKIDDYRGTLRVLDDWEPFLLQESGLPGPRGNLELAQAVADEGDERLFHRLLAFDPDSSPTNTPQEFLAFCGALGLGRLLAEGDRSVLRTYVSWPQTRAGACGRPWPWRCSATAR